METTHRPAAADPAVRVVRATGSREVHAGGCVAGRQFGGGQLRGAGKVTAAGLSPVGALALGCLLTALGFTLQGFRGRLRTWHSRAAFAAVAGLAAVVSALVLALVGL